MKKNTSFIKLFNILIVAMVCLSFQGCASIAKIKRNQQVKKDNAEKKKNLYHSLKRNIANNTLYKGTSVNDLKEQYGPPDDIFYSGSSVSSFQVWTYNASQDKLADYALSAIILYFENDKLVNWKY